MQKKIILHCGAPKTGSSSFQHLLYGNLDLLRAAGFYAPAVSRKKRPKDDIRILLGSLHKPGATKPANLKHIRAVIDRTFEKDNVNCLIISHEGLLGTPFASNRKGFYSNAGNFAKLIAGILDGYDVEVRFFIRDYSGFIPSWYVQNVRMGSRRSFEEFVNQLKLDQLSWTIPVTALVSNFGQSNVRILDHGDMVADTYATLCDAFPSVMATLGERGRNVPRKNKSIGKGMVNIYRRWNQIAHKLAPTPGIHRAVRHFVRHYMLLPFERFSRTEKLKLEPELATALSARYKQELAAIRQNQS